MSKANEERKCPLAANLQCGTSSVVWLNEQRAKAVPGSTLVASPFWNGAQSYDALRQKCKKDVLCTGPDSAENYCGSTKFPATFYPADLACECQSFMEGEQSGNNLKILTRVRYTCPGSYSILEFYNTTSPDVPNAGFCVTVEPDDSDSTAPNYGGPVPSKWTCDAVGLATARGQSPSTAGPAVSPEGPNKHEVSAGPESSSGISVGAALGLAIGGLALIALIVTIFLWRKRKARLHQSENGQNFTEIESSKPPQIAEGGPTYAQHVTPQARNSVAVSSCPNCGAPLLSSSSAFCSACGTHVATASVPLMAVNAVAIEEGESFTPVGVTSIPAVAERQGHERVQNAPNSSQRKQRAMANFLGSPGAASLRPSAPRLSRGDSEEVGL